MHTFLVNLLFGIIGGIYSSVIVSRVFLLREEIEEQLNILRRKLYYFGTLSACFDVIEMILKLQNDTSDEIEKEIKTNPEYLKTHDIIHANDVIKAVNDDILNKTVDKICNDFDPLILKQKPFIELENETHKIVRKYKNIKQFKFKTIDDSKKEIQELKQKYDSCLNNRNRYFLGQIVKDKVMIVLCVLLIILCIMIIVI